MFCIVCGMAAARENFCAMHYAERHSLCSAKDFSVDVCPVCGRGAPDDAMIESRVEKLGKVSAMKISTKRVGNRIIASIEASGTVAPGIPKREPLRVAITMRRRKCELCVKKSGGYYEGVVQVRGPRMEKIIGKLRAMLRADDVTSVERTKHGYDVKLISKKKAASVAVTLGRKHSVKSSFKLAAEKKGRKLYRSVYAIR